MKKKFPLSEANRAFRHKKFTEALEIYKDLEKRYPDSVSIFDANIKITKKYLDRVKKIVVVFHVFYEDEVDLYVSRIQLIKEDFDLIVTTPLPVDSDGIRKIKLMFPACSVIQHPNSGRDIAPFLKVWPLIEGYDLCCKIHTKRGTSKYTEIWRDLLVDGVLPSEDGVKEIIDKFRADKSLVMAGHEYLYGSYSHFVASNGPTIEFLCNSYDIKGHWSRSNGFFMGTMFWIRPQAYGFLDHLSDVSFESEAGLKDGAYEHAIERMMGSLTLDKGRILLVSTNQASKPRLKSVDCDYESDIRIFGQVFEEVKISNEKKNSIVGDINAGSGGDRMVSGWLALRGCMKPREALILIDGETYVEVKCDIYRPDLKRHGINDGRHAFQASVPFEYLDGREHRFVLIDKLSGKKIKEIEASKKGLSTLDIVTQSKKWDVEREERFQRFLEAWPDLTVKPLASIIMPTYNRAEVISTAIESVLNQTYKAWELIVIDDGGTDSTEELIRNRFPDSRIRYIKSDRRGVSGARNLGLKNVRGQYVFFLDTDNSWRNIYLSYMIAYMERTGLQGAFCGLEALDENGETKYYRGADFSWELCASGNYVDLNAFGHRKCDGVELFFDESLRRLVDWDYILEFSSTRSLGYAPFLGVKYYDGAGSRITNTVYNGGDELKGIIEWIQKKHSLRKIEQQDESFTFDDFNKRSITLPRKAVPDVSTIVIAYNHEKYISECLDSVLAQDLDYPYTVIVSDDGSTDGTRKILKSYAEKIVDISPVQNLGLSANLKNCIDNTTSEYVAICEGDDYWDSTDKLKKQIEFLEVNRDCSMVFSKLKILKQETGEVAFLDRQDKIGKNKLSGSDFLSDPTMNLIANFSCCVFRGEILRSMPDYMFTSRTNEIAVAFYFERFGSIGYIAEPLSVYRQHKEGLWTGADKTKQLISGLEARKMAFKAAQPKWKLSIHNVIHHNYRKKLQKL